MPRFFADNQDRPLDDSFQVWREKVLKVIYLVGVGFGLLVVGPILMMLLEMGQWPLLAVDSAILLWGVGALAFWKRIPYPPKAYLGCLVFLVAGVNVIWHLGPFSGGPVWLFTFPLICGFLLDTRASLAAVAINFLVLLGFGALLDHGVFPWVKPLNAPQMRWLVMSVNFALLNVVATVSTAYLTNRLMLSLNQQRQARLELLSEKEKLQVLTDKVPMGIMQVGPEGRLEYVNHRFEELFGRGVDEPSGQCAATASDQWRRFAGEGGARINEAVQMACAGGVEKSLFVRSVPLGGGRRMVMFEDVTDLQQTRLRLEKSERRFRQTADMLPAVVIEADFFGRLTYLNKMGLGKFELCDADIERGVFMGDLVSPDFHAEMERRVEAMRQGRWVSETEFAFIGRGGGRFTGLVNCGPIVQGDEVVGMRSVVLDISDRKASLEKLSKSELRYRTLFESITDYYCLHDLDGRILDLNPAGANAYGLKTEDLVGRRIPDLMPPELRQGFFSQYMAELREKGISSGVLTMMDHEERLHHLEYRNVLVHAPGEKPYAIAVGRDITERINAKRELARLHSQLQQAQKMEAVGTLAGGVAHDFNNILQAISGYAEVLDNSDLVHPAGRRYVEQVANAVQRAGKLVQQLLTFSRKVEPVLGAVDLDAEVRQTMGMLERTIPKMIDIAMELAPNLPPVWGDQSQIGQIILNLVANARDAMPEGGHLRLATGSRHLVEAKVDGQIVVPAGDWVLLEISDSGVGMSPRQMEQIFDPFFTTKPQGKGTGLGLSTVFGIVESHKGHIVCKSTQGMGSTFRVYLPAALDAQAVEEVEAAPGRTSTTPAGGGRVLLVDDEEPILEGLRAVLALNGYGVVTAGSGEEALAMFRGDGFGVDVVVLDLGMPGMGGLACMRQMLEHAPETRIIVASGYSKHGQFEDLLAEGAADYIRKPFNISRLLDKIKDVVAA